LKQVLRNTFGLNRGEIKNDRTNYITIFVIKTCTNYSYDDQSWLRRLEVQERKESDVVLFYNLTRQYCLGDLFVVGCVNVCYDVS
jgi:hypothetical protein